MIMAQALLQSLADAAIDIACLIAEGVDVILHGDSLGGENVFRHPVGSGIPVVTAAQQDGKLCFAVLAQQEAYRNRAVIHGDERVEGGNGFHGVEGIAGEVLDTDIDLHGIGGECPAEQIVEIVLLAAGVSVGIHSGSAGNLDVAAVVADSSLGLLCGRLPGGLGRILLGGGRGFLLAVAGQDQESHAQNGAENGDGRLRGNDARSGGNEEKIC